MLKAIETLYCGHRFRSRAEARWAVFFRTFGIAFEYEPQGFLVDGVPYLPDFLLPDLNLWLEVKGSTPSDKEKALLRSLADQTERRAVIAVGPPRPEPSLMLLDDYDSNERNFGEVSWYFAEDRRIDSILWILSEDYGCSSLHRGSEASDKWPIIGDRIKKAYEAAQQARFEHGETPT